MRILKNDLKHNLLTIKPESLDDLWLLEKFLGKGVVLSGRTERSIRLSSGEKTERKSIFVRLKAEGVSFENNQLRANGRIIESSNENVPHGYHAFEIEIGKPVTIEKEWKNYEIERIKGARIKQPKILICVLDDSCASFALLTERLSMLAEIKGISGKSYGTEDRTAYLKKVISYIKEKEFEKLIIAGPGFTKEDVTNLIGKNEPEIARKTYTDSVSNTGEAGIKEILRRGIIERVNKESRLGKQALMVERFLSALGKEGLVTYGKKEVWDAIRMGAVEKFLICDKLVHENEGMLSDAEKTGANVNIIETESEPGERLMGLGGFGAFLRYKIE